MTARPPLQFTLTILLAAAAAAAAGRAAASDTDALTAFRLAADAHGVLAANWSSGDACSGRWTGVVCSGAGRVTSLFLPSLDLRGPLDALAALAELRAVDLSGNRLNGSLLPFLAALPNLRLLYLRRNDIAGVIPPAAFLNLTRLVRVDLGENSISGEIPPPPARLITLRLQNNLLTGALPDLTVVAPKLAELNVSFNELSGEVPEKMRVRFGVDSFLGNAGLCGASPPLPACQFIPNIPVPVSPSPPSSPSAVIPSNPASATTTESKPKRSPAALSTAAIAGIAAGNVLLVLFLLALVIVYCCCCTGTVEEEAADGGDKKIGIAESDADGEGQSKLVFFDSGGRFEVEELLRASAEMVGKGSLGTVYRATLDDVAGGRRVVVAVKRLRDANPCARRDFHRYMDVIGGLRSRHLVALRAFYYAKQEKLLIYDFLPGGTLHSRLHGGRGTAGRVPLDWTARCRLLLGAARGLASIHDAYSSPPGIPHGNVKSANVLLDAGGDACVADFGLSLLLSPAHAVARLSGYAAPEQAGTKRLSQEADVYSFGVMILEVLTGRPPLAPPETERMDRSAALPEWVQSVVKEEWTAEVFDVELLRYADVEEEMVAMLHVGIACCAAEPERRPAMAQVVKMIEEIPMGRSSASGLEDSAGDVSGEATTDDGDVGGRRGDRAGGY